MLWPQPVSKRLADCGIEAAFGLFGSRKRNYRILTLPGALERQWAAFWAPCALCRRKIGQEGLCRLHCGDQRADAQNIHDALEIVGQNMQRHLGADISQRLHLEVRRPHPVLDGSERVLDGVEPDVHFLRMLVEPALDRLDDMFMFPARDAAFLALGTEILDRASLTGIGPVAVQRLSVFHVGEVMRQAFASRANVDAMLTMQRGGCLPVQK